MIGTIAIIAGLLFVGSALYSFAPGAPPSLRTVTLGAGVVAGLLGIASWGATHDTRWLVGGVLTFGGAVPAWAAGRRRAITIVAVILGLLGVALYGIATNRPMQRPAATV